MTAARGRTSTSLPASLPAAFSYSDARRHGLSEHRLRALRDGGALESPRRGLYLRADANAADPDLLEIAARAPEATLCLRSALARHDLIDDIPYEIDIALPRGRRTPRTAAPARWHHFDKSTFHIGRQAVELSHGLDLGLYSPERCIVDAFRLQHHEGSELATDALKAWLRRQEAKPADLLALAGAFPKAQPSLRRALQILL